MDFTPRVLSIQSHVVHGYAGNRCAVFPLQTLGFEVDFINTVQLSTHTGYPVFKGSRMSASELHDIFQGLKSSKVDKYSHLLSGYVGTLDFLDELVDVIKSLKVTNENVTYVCDPVLGDDGRFYVPPEFAKVYREKLIPLSDIVTPNQFELGVLTQMKVDTLEDILKAVDRLHELGVPQVVVTSAVLEDDNLLTCVGSHKKGGERFKFEVQRLPMTFVGTGDVFAATVLAWSSRERRFEAAVSKALNTVQGIIADTASFAQKLQDSGSDLCSAAIRELRLVQNRDLFNNPPERFLSVNL